MRLSKETWISKGIKVLNGEGYDAIKIDHLCEKFGVTKGSFYHHFESIKEYEEHLLKYWEAETIGRITKIIHSGITPKERLNLLISQVFGVSGKTELSLRAWALHNKTVKKYLDKMDDQRISVVKNLYHQLGTPEKEAGDLAEFAYVAWLGIQCYYVNPSKNKEKSVQLMNELLGIPVKGMVHEV